MSSGATEIGITRLGQVAIVEEPRIIAAMPDHDLWMSFFRDTEGNVMAFMSEVPRKS